MVYEFLKYGFKQSLSLLRFMILKFDDVTASKKELKWKIRYNFEKYSKFLKIPRAGLWVGS